MSPDTGPSLRTALCLTNPSGLQAARWGSLDAKFKYEYWPSSTR